MTATTEGGDTASAASRLVPLRVHRLQHAQPPAHHVFTTNPQAGDSASTGPWAALAAYLPHWHAVPERFFHPKHRRPKSKQHPQHQHQHYNHQQDSSSVTGHDDDNDNNDNLLRIGFQNPWPSFHRPSFWQIWHSLRWGVPPPHMDADMEEERHASHREKKKLRQRIRTDPELHLSIEQPDFSYHPGTVKATWVGHAGTLLTLPPVHRAADSEPFRVLFDPIFSDRCSPLKGAGPLRAYAPPCKLTDLPPIDLVIISHNHYDHLDYDTISDLWNANEHRGIRFIAPLGNKTWFVQEGLGIDPDRVVELDWWDELVLGGEPVLPVPQHELEKEEAHIQHALDQGGEEEAAALSPPQPKLHAEVLVPVAVPDLEPAVPEASQEEDKSENAQSRPVPERKQTLDTLPEDVKEELTEREQDALRDPSPSPFVRVICTPAQHQSGRYAVDACSALWSSWVVEYHYSDSSSSSQGNTRSKCFRSFFGGDTGYRFHDTVAAAAKEAAAKAAQAERQRAEAGPSPIKRMSTKLSKKLSGAGSRSGSKNSSRRSSGTSSPQQQASANGNAVRKDEGSVTTGGGDLPTPPPEGGDDADKSKAAPATQPPPILTSDIRARDSIMLDSPQHITISSASTERPAKVSKQAEEQEPEQDGQKFPACPAFLHITAALGRPHLLLLPISVGATISFLKSYDPLPPRWSPFPRVDERLTSAVHMGPEDAVRVLQLMTVEASKKSGSGGKKGDDDEDEDDDDVAAPPPSAHLRRYAHLGLSGNEGAGATLSEEHAATALAIHWGTFVGGKDEIHQSIRALRRACVEEGVQFTRAVVDERVGEATEITTATEEGEAENVQGRQGPAGKNVFALVNHGESVTVRM
ncbi:hypothetical protein OC845_002404 [Tilletia horrida]|nr:hypothetical protein OC845_002404 [Tilletia horrida]